MAMFVLPHLPEHITEAIDGDTDRTFEPEEMRRVRQDADDPDLDRTA